MGRHENEGFRGYLVRVQTKEGRVFRHRKLRMVLDKGQDQTITTQTQRLGEPVSENIVEQDEGSQTEGVSAASFQPTVKSGTRKAVRGIGRFQAVEETTLDEFLGLARGHTKFPGEVTGARGVDVVDADDEQLARLYRLGVLYDGPSRDPEDAVPSIEGPASSAANSAYQADSLDTIRHAEPLYTVRHVIGKRRGKRTSSGTSAAKQAPLDVDLTEAEQTKEAGGGVAETEGFHSRDLPLFAFDGIWEDGEGQTIDGRALWNDLEEFEYVVLRDDDLASMAGSWVELESVLGTDDGDEGE
ncbi:MAG: hypothetical protein STHCBS139747_006693 [Sporothrix thermara]